MGAVGIAPPHAEILSRLHPRPGGQVDGVAQKSQGGQAVRMRRDLTPHESNLRPIRRDHPHAGPPGLGVGTQIEPQSPVEGAQRFRLLEEEPAERAGIDGVSQRGPADAGLGGFGPRRLLRVGGPGPGTPWSRIPTPAPSCVCCRPSLSYLASAFLFDPIPIRFPSVVLPFGRKPGRRTGRRGRG